MRPVRRYQRWFAPRRLAGRMRARPDPLTVVGMRPIAVVARDRPRRCLVPRQVFEEAVEGSRERIDFLIRQKVEQISPHVLDVVWCRRFDGLLPASVSRTIRPRPSSHGGFTIDGKHTTLLTHHQSWSIVAASSKLDVGLPRKGRGSATGGKGIRVSLGLGRGNGLVPRPSRRSVADLRVERWLVLPMSRYSSPTQVGAAR